MTLYYLTVDNELKKYEQRDFASESYEKHLEEWVLNNPSVLVDGGEEIMFIRQERRLEKREDLMGIDREGNVIVVELKRGRTPREVVAQAIEYVAKISYQSYDEIEHQALLFFKKQNRTCMSLYQAYAEYFYDPIGEDSFREKLNKSQRIFIVAQDISDDVVLMSNYLISYGIDITCISFSYYRDEEKIVIDVTTETGGVSDKKPFITSPISYTSGFLNSVKDEVLNSLKADMILDYSRNPNKIISFAVNHGWSLYPQVKVESNDRKWLISIGIIIVSRDWQDPTKLVEQIELKAQSLGQSIHKNNEKSKNRYIYEQKLVEELDALCIDKTVMQLINWIDLVFNI